MIQLFVIQLLFNYLYIIKLFIFLSRFDQYFSKILHIVVQDSINYDHSSTSQSQMSTWNIPKCHSKMSNKFTFHLSLYMSAPHLFSIWAEQYYMIKSFCSCGAPYNIISSPLSGRIGGFFAVKALSVTFRHHILPQWFLAHSFRSMEEFWMPF